LVGLFATWRSFDLRLAAVASFLWGAAGIHIHMNFRTGSRRIYGRKASAEPGNASVVCWTDIVIPAIGFAPLWLQRRYEMEGRSAAPLPRLRRI
jgi:hypothetical protein